MRSGIAANRPAELESMGVSRITACGSRRAPQSPRAGSGGTAMRKSASVPILRALVILLTLCFAAHAYADDRSEARTHYQAGVRYYTSGDYRGANARLIVRAS